MKKILFIYGTRPEAIKLAPLIIEFKKNIKFDVKVCVTAQHREMMDQVNIFFNIKPDYDLDIMKSGQDLFDITGKILNAIKSVLIEVKPDIIFVQGDTTSVFTAALAGFYNKINIAHIEAGLRSDNIYSPFPEEINRRLTSVLADFHFAPTQKAKQSLIKENIIKDIYVVGNTVIDALLMALRIIKENEKDIYDKKFSFLDFTKKIILVTGHRRESFGIPFENMCNAIKDIALLNPNIQIVYPVHLNPNVRKPVNKILAGLFNVFLIEPIDYSYFVWLMEKSYLILTDSGGIQEEAPTLGKPVLVMRDVTERMEGVEAGVAKLVGSDRKKIVDNVQSLISDYELYLKMSKCDNPYGDGTASIQIIKIIEDLLFKNNKDRMDGK